MYVHYAMQYRTVEAAKTTILCTILFAECPAGQIVKYKLNNNKKNIRLCSTHNSSELFKYK